MYPSIALKFYIEVHMTSFCCSCYHYIIQLFQSCTKFGNILKVQEVGESYAPTFNLDQLEECDSAPEESCSLLRLDAESHSISHQVNILFPCNLSFM